MTRVSLVFQDAAAAIATAAALIDLELAKRIYPLIYFA